jgi:alpha-amylase/alpha-mannosidase (GH57 family)
MERYVCVHGHFYQPPRENPWLEAIEIQDSAHPYHDWNERINAECYAPNTASRIVRGDGYIIDIVNNYSKMSFNFGPTLLSWLEGREPDIYKAILDADRLSMERFSGHGSAMAQCYNHMIMPLANHRDKYTQVCWGIKDFRGRFGREPEGMWLPETAVDLESLDIMASMGIKFTILAPRQAKRVRPADNGNGWQDVEGSRIDPTTNYVCFLPSGKSIALYFYDGPISQGIAFEGLLKSGEILANRLLGAFNDSRGRDQLVHIATDGETYGHHHKYGDMALAYALYYVESKGAKVTNYGEHLEKHPPTEVVEIYENSSWSCVHGVERWRDNCGCSSGMHPGWHQMWRRPLREALDALRDRCIPVFESEGKVYLKDPWEARNDYLDVVHDRSVDNVEAFLAAHQSHDLTEDEKRKALMLLGIQRCAMLMYTSCGWFFDEISGIETDQVIKYASRLIQLAESLDESKPLEAEFVKALEKAPSNLMGNGAAVYELHVKPSRVDILRAVGHDVVSSLFVEFSGGPRVVYSYDLEYEAYEHLDAGPRRLAVGRIKARNRLTWEKALITFAAVNLRDTNVIAGLRHFISPEAYTEMSARMAEAFGKGDVPEIVRAMDKEFEPSRQYSLRHLFKDEQRRIIDVILKPKYDQVHDVYLGMYQANYNVMDFLRSLGNPLPKALSYAADATIHMGLARVFDSGYNIERLRRLIDDARKWPVAIETDETGLAAVSWIDTGMRQLEKEPLGPEAVLAMDKIKDTIQILRDIPLELHPWRAQNLYFGLKNRFLDEMRKKTEEGDYEAGRWVQAFKELGTSLRVQA